MPLRLPRFRTGQAIVCIDDNFAVLIANAIVKSHDDNYILPKLNRVYHVRMNVVHENGIGVLLKEIINHTLADGRELNFSEDRFVPLDELPSPPIEESVSEPVGEEVEESVEVLVEA